MVVWETKEAMPRTLPMIADAGNPIRADQSAARRDCAGGGKPGDARDLRLRMAAAHNICGHERKAECAWPALRD